MRRDGDNTKICIPTNVGRNKQPYSKLNCIKPCFRQWQIFEFNFDRILEEKTKIYANKKVALDPFPNENHSSSKISGIGFNRIHANVTHTHTHIHTEEIKIKKSGCISSISAANDFDKFRLAFLFVNATRN